MAGDKRPSWKEARQAERNRNLLMVAVPVILLILIAVITLADRSSEKDNTDAETAPSQVETSVDPSAETPAESGDGSGDANGESNGETCAPDPLLTSEEAASQPDDTASAQILTKSEIAEIDSLMKNFLEARAKCDPETVFKLYGRTDVSTFELEESRRRMLINAREIKSIDNIECYTAQGLDEYSWVVYTLYNMNLRGTNTPAPSGMFSYVVQDEAGTYTLVQPASYTDEMAARVNEVIRSEEGVELSDTQYKKLTDAVAADAELRKKVAVLQADSPVWIIGETEPETEQEVQILPE